MAIAEAFRHCTGVPPRISVIPAAAIATAAPTSAWQPAAAADNVALLATTMPTADAANNPLKTFSVLHLKYSPPAMIVPGITPAPPAVGKAAILPIAELVSPVAVAYA